MKNTSKLISQKITLMTALVAFASPAFATTIERSASDCDMSLNYTANDESGSMTEKVEGLYVRFEQGTDIFVFNFQRNYNVVSNDNDSPDSSVVSFEHRVVTKADANNKPLMVSSLTTQYAYNGDGTTTATSNKSTTRTEYKADGVSLLYVKQANFSYNQPLKATRTDLGDNKYSYNTVVENLDMDATDALPTAVHVDNQTMACNYTKSDVEEFNGFSAPAAVKFLNAFNVLITKVDAAQNDVDVCSKMGWDCTSAKKTLQAAIDARNGFAKKSFKKSDYAGVNPFVN